MQSSVDSRINTALFFPENVLVYKSLLHLAKAILLSLRSFALTTLPDIQINEMILLRCLKVQRVVLLL